MEWTERWQSKEGIESVIEEAAYTCLTGIMAIRILSKKGYDSGSLEYERQQNSTLLTSRRGPIRVLGLQREKKHFKSLTIMQRNAKHLPYLRRYCEIHQLLKSIFHTSFGRT